jgi:IS30 family transposase
MTQHHSTTVKRIFKHLPDIDRGQLQAMYRSGLYTQKEMADILGVSQSTISRELKRGMTEQVKLVNGKREHYERYFGDVGARVYQENRERSRQKGIEKYDQDFLKSLPEALKLPIGKKTKGEPVILTLLERQTRYYVTKKLWNKSPEHIREAMLKIIKEHGPQNFKTITTDNGSEFRALSKLENTYEHLGVYYAHAYASWGKGANERHNGMLHEFIPKGISLRDLTYKRLKQCANALNMKLRRTLGYACPQELYEQKRQENAASQWLVWHKNQVSVSIKTL